MSGGGSGGGGSSTTTQVSTIPDWLSASYQQSVDRANAVSQEPTPIYQGQRIANTTAPTQQAYNTAEAGIGAYQPVYNAGVANTAAAGQQFNQGDFNQFMNPYTSQVTDEIARLGNQNFNDVIMPGVNSQFTGNGMFGSSRNADVLGQEAAKAQAGITGQQSQALQQGFNQSMQNYQNAQGRQLQAGQDLVGQAGAGQNMLGSDVNLLSNIGQQQQNQQQLGLDTAYNDFLTQAAAPKANAQWFSDIVHGIDANNLVTQQKQTIAPQGNSINQAIGTVGSLAKAQSGTSAFAKGGKVKAKRAESTKTRSSTPMGLGGMAYA